MRWASTVTAAAHGYGGHAPRADCGCGNRAMDLHCKFSFVRICCLSRSGCFPCEGTAAGPKQKQNRVGAIGPLMGDPSATRLVAREGANPQNKSVESRIESRIETRGEGWVSAGNNEWTQAACNSAAAMRPQTKAVERGPRRSSPHRSRAELQCRWEATSMRRTWWRTVRPTRRGKARCLSPPLRISRSSGAHGIRRGAAAAPGSRRRRRSDRQQ